MLAGDRSQEAKKQEEGGRRKEEGGRRKRKTEEGGRKEFYGQVEVDYYTTEGDRRRGKLYPNVKVRYPAQALAVFKFLF